MDLEDPIMSVGVSCVTVTAEPSLELAEMELADEAIFEVRCIYSGPLAAQTLGLNGEDGASRCFLDLRACRS